MEKKPTYTLRDYVFMGALLLVIIGTIAAFVSMPYTDNYSPLHDHVQYVLDKHGDSCKYEIGKCPESLCSHSAIQ